MHLSKSCFGLSVKKSTPGCSKLLIPVNKGKPQGGLSGDMLFAQDHAQEAIVNRQRAVVRVIDKAQRPELVQEITDPRPGGADHLGQVFLIDSGMDRFGSVFLAKMRQQ